MCSNYGIYDFSINYEDCEDIKNNDKTYNYGNYNKYISDKIIKNINLVLDWPDFVVIGHKTNYLNKKR